MNIERKLNLIGAAMIFHACKLLYKRDSKLWVFGALSGKKYDDNTKYLFEYINEKHSDDLRAVWLAGDDKVVDDFIIIVDHVL